MKTKTIGIIILIFLTLVMIFSGYKAVVTIEDRCNKTKAEIEHQKTLNIIKGKNIKEKAFIIYLKQTNQTVSIDNAELWHIEDSLENICN